MGADRTADLLDFDARFVDGCTTVELGGFLDVRTCARLRENLLELSDRGHHRLAIDLSGVDFMDSSGLGTLVGAHKRAAAGGGMLVLVGVPERVLTKVFPILQTLDEAIKHLESAAAA